MLNILLFVLFNFVFVRNGNTLCIQVLNVAKMFIFEKTNQIIKIYSRRG